MPPYKLFYFDSFFFFFSKKFKFHALKLSLLGFLNVRQLTCEMDKVASEHTEKWLLPSLLFWRVQTLIHSCSGKCFYGLMSVACTWFLCQERVSKLAVAALCYFMFRAKWRKIPVWRCWGMFKSATKKGCKSQSERDWWCLWNILSGCQKVFVPEA